MDENKDIELTTYEVGYILIPTLSDEAALEEAGKIVNLVEEAGGSLFKQKNPEMMDLAYDMKKEIERKRHTFNKAHFGSIIFDLASDKIADIKKALDESDTVLRFLIIKVSKKILEQQEAKRNYAPRKQAVSEKEEKAISGEALDSEIDALIAETEVDLPTQTDDTTKEEDVKTE